MDDADLSEMLDLIYAVAVAPDRWPELLQHLARVFGCHTASMNISKPDRTDFRALVFGIDAAEHQNFLRRFNRSLPVPTPGRPVAAGKTGDDCDFISPGMLEQTEMYQAYYRPHEMGHSIRFPIWSGRAGMQTAGLSRPWRAAAFDEQERRLARTLLPHLQRAAQVTRHMRNADLLTKAAHATLDTVPHAVLLLNCIARPVYLNRDAERLLRTSDGLSVGRETLSGATPAATRALAALIGAAAVDPAKGGTLRLPRPSGKPALVMVAIPIRGLNDFCLSDHPAVILCVSDPDARETIDPTLLASLFGLTRAEAELAGQLLAGQDLQAIAASSGRSIHTVRNLLVRVMAKTETGRQSDLVGLLGRLPRIPGDA